ncbi:MAG TPA: enoyl-CoA hydratase-related protein, partial [Steroidobacteraceae bacterium]|nr:enoyl-CoA hydratase-related protein [Steroidobacteraceae bacterium]
MTDHVRVAIDQGIMTLTLNRPEKKNAITNAMYGVLGESLARADSDSKIRVVLIQAEGDAFTSGNDLGDFAAVAAGTLKREEMKSGLFLSGLARAQKPLIAAVQGLAVGVGTTLLLHCDFAYVADDAQLSTPFVNLGLVPEAASSLLLPARIGYARAFQLFALGEPIDGRRAAAIGLVTASAPAHEVRSMALATAKKLTDKPSGALKAMKRLLR